MKKIYTKKQICEAIAYWEKQLRSGNYKKINESDDGYKTVHVYDIEWQPVDDDDDDVYDDTFEEVDIDVEDSEMDNIEEVIHDYLSDNCESSSPENFKYKVI